MIDFLIDWLTVWGFTPYRQYSSHVTAATTSKWKVLEFWSFSGGPHEPTFLRDPEKRSFACQEVYYPWHGAPTNYLHILCTHRRSYEVTCTSFAKEQSIAHVAEMKRIEVVKVSFCTECLKLSIGFLLDVCCYAMKRLFSYILSFSKQRNTSIQRAG